MTYQAKNDAYSTLASSLTNTGTSLTVSAGQGDRFPIITGSDYTLVTLRDSSGNFEIVEVTARPSASDVMTIARGQEGSTQKAWGIGTVVELGLTAGLIQQSIAHPTNPTGAHAASAIQVTPTGHLASTDVQSALAELDSDLTNAINNAQTNLVTHENNPTGAHAASAISFNDTISLAATTIQAAIIALFNLIGLRAFSGANTDITSLNSPNIQSATCATQTPGNNSNKVANTTYVDSAVAVETAARIAADNAITASIPSATVAQANGLTATGLQNKANNDAAGGIGCAVTTSYATSPNASGLGGGWTHFMTSSYGGQPTLYSWIRTS